MNRGQQALWDMTRATEPTKNKFKLRPDTASSAHEAPSKSMKDLSNAGDGIEVIKISSSGKLQVRFFSISNNNRTVLLSSEKTKGGKVSMFSQSSHRRIDVSALLWVQKGQFTDKFHEAKRNVSHVDQRGKKKNVDRSQVVLPNSLQAEDEELSLSIYYREHDTKGNQLRFTQTLDLIFLSEYDCNLVQMALQEMMHLYHASRLTVEDQDVLLLEQIFLSIGKDIGRNGIGYYYADLSQSWHQDKRLLAKEATEKKKSSQGKVGLTDICNILHNRIQCDVLSKSTIKKLYKTFCTMETIKPDAGLNLIQLASFFRQIRMKSLKEMSIANPMNIIWNDLQKIFVVKSSYKSQNQPKDGEEQNDTDEENDDMSALTQDNELDAVNNGYHTGSEGKGKVMTPKEKTRNTADTVNCATFMKFMRLIQKDPDLTLLDTKKTFQRISNQRDVDDMMCRNVGEQYITNIEDATTKDIDEIGRDKFFSYLWSDRNDIFDPEKGRDENDMSQPLCSYWINSSHNTFLYNTGKQGDISQSLPPPTIDVSCQGYTDALYRGCRSVEVRTWDGPCEEAHFNLLRPMKGVMEPVVSLSDPLSSSSRSDQKTDPNRKKFIYFFEVIKIIRSFLLSNPESYPIILCIENHCTIAVQQKIAKYLKDVLGESKMLYIPPEDYDGPLPSPEALKGKVLVKGKRSMNRAVHDENADGAVLNDDFDDELDQAPENEPLTDHSHGAIDDNRFALRAIFSVVSDVPHPPQEKSLSELYNISREEAKNAKEEAKVAEKVAFEIEVKAKQAEDHAKKLSDVYLQGNNDQGSVHTKMTETSSTGGDTMAYTVGEDPTVDLSCVSLEFKEFEEALQVEQYFAKALGESTTNYEMASAALTRANETVAISMASVQDVSSALALAENALEKAKKGEANMTTNAEQAASEAKLNLDHAETASKRVTTIKSMLKKSENQLANAKAVAFTAKTEADVSEKHACEAEKKAEGAFDTAKFEEARAEVESEKEKRLEQEAAVLRKKCHEAANQSLSLKHQMDKTASNIKDIDEVVESMKVSKSIYDDDDNMSAYTASSKFSKASRSSKTNRKNKLDERRQMSDALMEAKYETGTANMIRKKAEGAYNDAAQRARMQSEIAGAARRYADQSMCLAEQLADHADEERGAADLRKVASEKAEITVQRCVADRASLRAQLAEADRAAKGSDEIAISSRKEAEKLAGDASASDLVYVYTKKLASQVAFKDKAKEAYNAALAERGETSGKVAEVKRRMDLSKEVFDRAQREAVAKKHKLKAGKQSESNAVAARERANYLRKEAEEAKIQAASKLSIAAKKVAAERHAQQYKTKKEKIKPVCESYSDLILLHSSKFKFWEKSITLSSTFMHSLSQQKVDFMVRAGENTWRKCMEYNSDHITRTFPSSIDNISKKYNPVIPWSMGCQLVSMNFQKPCDALWVNDGRFRQNGSTGYVLKPNKIIHGATRRDPHDNFGESELPSILSLQVIAGNRLVHSRNSMNIYDQSDTKTDAVNSLVKISMYDGISSEESDSIQQHITRSLKGNLLNPVWNETEEECAKFKVSNPSMATLVISVWDSVNGGNIMGTSAVPFSCIREGYRSVPLFDENHMRCGQHAFSSLLVYVRVK